jgi:hypothetical protein
LLTFIHNVHTKLNEESDGMLAAQRYGYPPQLYSLALVRARHEAAQVEELSMSMRECTRRLERLEASVSKLEAATVQPKRGNFA